MVSSPVPERNPKVSVSDQMRNANLGSPSAGHSVNARRRRRGVILKATTLCECSQAQESPLRVGSGDADTQRGGAVLHDLDASVRLNVAVANGSSSITVPLKASPVRMDSVDLSRNVKASFFESSSCTGVTVNRKKSLFGKNDVLVQGSGGVVHRGNGGGRTATDTFGLDGDLAQRVDRLLARGRLTVCTLPGRTSRKAPDSDGYAVRSGCSEFRICCRTLVDRANGRA